MSGHYVRGPERHSVIVFVHGLWGSAQSTWRNHKTRAYWPDLICNDPNFNEFDVYVVDYRTPKLINAPTIEEVAIQTSEEFNTQEFWSRYPRIFFIAHSLGGIITRRFLTKRANDASVAAIGQVKSVLFFSTPTHGSGLAQVASALSQNPQVVSFCEGKGGFGVFFSCICFEKGSAFKEIQRQLDNGEMMVIAF